MKHGDEKGRRGEKGGRAAMVLLLCCGVARVRWCPSGVPLCLGQVGSGD
jgi:hypothetical protein